MQDKDRRFALAQINRIANWQRMSKLNEDTLIQHQRQGQLDQLLLELRDGLKLKKAIKPQRKRKPKPKFWEDAPERIRMKLLHKAARRGIKLIERKLVVRLKEQVREELRKVETRPYNSYRRQYSLPHYPIPSSDYSRKNRKAPTEYVGTIAERLHKIQFGYLSRAWPSRATFTPQKLSTTFLPSLHPNDVVSSRDGMVIASNFIKLTKTFERLTLAAALVLDDGAVSIWHVCHVDNTGSLQLGYMGKVVEMIEEWNGKKAEKIHLTSRMKRPENAYKNAMNLLAKLMAEKMTRK